MRWQSEVRRIGQGLCGAAVILVAACSADRASTNGGKGAADSAASPASSAENTPGGAYGAASSATGSTRRVQRVVFLGTSLTAGLGLDPEKAYPALLQAKADSAGYAVRIVNAGLSGETSAGALRRAAWVLDQPAAMVVLEVGANDGLRGVDPDSTYANLVKLVAAVRAGQPGVSLALIQMEAPTNLGRSYTTRFHAAYERVARETGIPLWPFLLDGVAGDAALNQPDGIHPNVVGSQRVAETVWGALGPALATLQASPTPAPSAR